MNKENPFEDPRNETKDSKNKEPVKGAGFTMREGNSYGQNVAPHLEFRPGETSETARNREEKERERLQKYREQETKITSEEQARKDREYAAEWFEERIEKQGEYSETLGIEKDGSFNREKRFGTGVH